MISAASGTTSSTSWSCCAPSGPGGGAPSYPPELSDERVRETLLAGYESVRGLPPDHERLFGTLDVMQRVAAVNRNLELRASPAAHEVRGEKFLRQSVVWLERNHSW